MHQVLGVVKFLLLSNFQAWHGASFDRVKFSYELQNQLRMSWTAESCKFLNELQLDELQSLYGAGELRRKFEIF
jgi:hypothetical protein